MVLTFPQPKRVKWETSYTLDSLSKDMAFHNADASFEVNLIESSDYYYLTQKNHFQFQRQSSFLCEKIFE